MQTSNVNGAWIIYCAHPECEERWIVERCSADHWPYGQPQTPSLPNGHPKGEYEGWYWRPHRKKMLYTAYCPVHAEAAHKHARDHKLWYARRQTEGKVVAYSWLDKLGWLSRLLPQKKTAEHMAEWEKNNPRPIPPWEANNDEEEHKSVA